jgi:hypothetical protein
VRNDVHRYSSSVVVVRKQIRWNKPVSVPVDSSLKASLLCISFIFDLVRLFAASALSQAETGGKSFQRRQGGIGRFAFV